MESFLATLIFLLPGLMLYFWLQSFGINPVVKHTPAEFTGVSALLWLPISLSAIKCYNLIVQSTPLIKHHKPIWDTAHLNASSGDFLFIIIFLGCSLVISFIFGALWAKWGHKYIYLFLINSVRKWRGAAEFSDNTSVWDDAFHANKAQIVEVLKLGEEKGRIGEIKNVSRTFEPGRDLLLRHTETWEKILEEYEVSVANIFVDTKSGVIIKIYDSSSANKAQELYKAKLESIS